MIKFVIIPTSEVSTEMRTFSEIEIISKGTPSKTILNFNDKNKPTVFNDYEEFTRDELADERQENILFWYGQKALDFENAIKESYKNG